MKRVFPLPTSDGLLPGELALPAAARGLILFADLPGTDPADLGLTDWAVLFMPLLSAREMRFPDSSHNVPLLSQRLIDVLDLIRNDGDTETLPLGLFATAAAAPAAIRAAARRDAQVRALVCHGGLIDLAGRQYLDLLEAPLLVLGSADDTAAETSFRHAAPHLSAPHHWQALAPGELPAEHAARWFEAYLQAI